MESYSDAQTQQSFTNEISIIISEFNNPIFRSEEMERFNSEQQRRMAKQVNLKIYKSTIKGFLSQQLDSLTPQNVDPIIEKIISLTQVCQKDLREKDFQRLITQVKNKNYPYSSHCAYLKYPTNLQGLKNQLVSFLERKSFEQRDSVQQSLKFIVSRMGQIKESMKDLDVQLRIQNFFSHRDSQIKYQSQQPSISSMSNCSSLNEPNYFQKIKQAEPSLKLIVQPSYNPNQETRTRIKADKQQRNNSSDTRAQKISKERQKNIKNRKQNSPLFKKIKQQENPRQNFKEKEEIEQKQPKGTQRSSKRVKTDVSIQPKNKSSGRQTSISNKHSQQKNKIYPQLKKPAEKNKKQIQKDYQVKIAKRMQESEKEKKEKKKQKEK